MLVWAMRTRTALRAVPVLVAVCLRNYLASAEVVDANSASKNGASSGRGQRGQSPDSGSKASAGGKAPQRLSTPGPDSSSDESVNGQVCPGAEPWRT